MDSFDHKLNFANYDMLHVSEIDVEEEFETNVDLVKRRRDGFRNKHKLTVHFLSLFWSGQNTLFLAYLLMSVGSVFQHLSPNRFSLTFLFFTASNWM